MNYNVLNEKWANVKMKNGEIRKASLRELFENAHEIDELNERDIVFECSIYRFLFTFAMDLFRLDEHDDVVDLLETGMFDMKRFDNYVKECELEGTSFDLFDTNRPFMQYAFCDYNEDDIKSISFLDPKEPSGTNKLFHEKTIEKKTAVSPEKAFKLLLSQTPFCTSPGSGWKGADFGAFIPLYIYIKGDSLFSTIVINILTKESILEKRNYITEDDPVFWRNTFKNGIENMKDCHKQLPLIAQMEIPYRLIRLIPNDDGTVSRIYCSKHGYIGLKDSRMLLRDPYIVYLKPNSKDKGPFSNPWCAKSSEREWLNMMSICEAQSQPAIVTQYHNILSEVDSEIFSIISYATVIKDTHGTFVDSWKNTFSFPPDVLEKNGVLDRIEQALDEVQLRKRDLDKGLKKAFLNHKDIITSVCDTASSSFYGECKKEFFKVFLPKVTNTNDRETLSKEWTFFLKRTVEKKYDQITNDMLRKTEDCKAAYRGRFEIIKRDFDNDDTSKKGTRAND